MSVRHILLGIGQMDGLGVVIVGILLLKHVIPGLAPKHIVDEHLRVTKGASDLAERVSARA